MAHVKLLGCHLGPLEELFPYKSMAVLGSQNGTIKNPKTPHFSGKKKSQPTLFDRVVGGSGGCSHLQHFTVTAAGIQ